MGLYFRFGVVLLLVGVLMLQESSGDAVTKCKKCADTGCVGPEFKGTDDDDCSTAAPDDTKKEIKLCITKKDKAGMVTKMCGVGTAAEACKMDGDDIVCSCDKDNCNMDVVPAVTPAAGQTPVAAANDTSAGGGGSDASGPAPDSGSGVTFPSAVGLALGGLITLSRHHY